MNRIVTAWIICVLGLVVLLACLGRDFMPSEQQDSHSSAALIHGAFTLRSAEGKTVTEQDFKGKYLLVYFGYTHCPDMCPTSLLLIQNALGHLGGLADKIQPIFISVDPERDTPKVTGAYAANFGPRMLGLSGTPEQVKEAAENYKVYYSKVEQKDSALGYVMDHSGFIYLMGPDASYLTHFPYNVSESELEEGLKKYVR